MTVRAASQFGLLLRLRLRTMFRGVARRKGLVVLLLLTIPVALGLALFLGWVGLEGSRWLASGEASGRIPPGSLAEWVHLALFATFAWLILLPVLGFAGNEFYDITKLFHLPVAHGTVFLAQTVGLLAGGTVLMFLPFLVGVILGIPGGAGAVACRLALVLLLVTNAVILSQLIQLLLLNVLRSRRFRDLAAILAALLSGAVFVAFRILAEAGDVRHQLLTMLSHRSSRYLLVSPSSWISSAVAPGADSSRYLPLMTAFLALTALAVLASVSLQRRAFFGEVPLARVRKPARARRRRGLRGPGWIPGPVRAVAAKEFTLLRREPVVKTLLIQQAVFVLAPLIILFVMGRGRGDLEVAIVSGGCLLLFVESHLVLNLFGLEGAGVTQLLLTPLHRGRVIAGKLLAYGTMFAVANFGALGITLLIAAVTGHPVESATATLLAAGFACGLMILLGLGGAISVYLPFPLTAKGRRSLSQARAGREGCLMSVVRLMVFTLFLVLLLPLFFLCRRPVLVPVAFAYSGLILIFGQRWGGSLLAGREGSLIGRLTRSTD